jgi:homoserine kinase
VTVVRVPATTANLGAGFDALGLALSYGLELALDADDAHPAAAGESHPATRAFRSCGGSGTIAVRTDFPPGRGLGFSGASRVAGVVAAAVQRGAPWSRERRDLLAVAAAMEGHGDNAAASMFGGLIVCAGTHSIAVIAPDSFRPHIVLWIPDRETSTKQSRSALPTTVSLDDAVHNLGRAALFVAAWAAGDTSAFATATDDRWHQPHRLPLVPESAAALAAMQRAGAQGAWLSGSGPTVGALACDDETRDAIVAALGEHHAGRTSVVGVDYVGTTVDEEGTSATWN